MNKIEKLIKELCPNGVEWKKLGEVCECITGGDSPKDCVKGQKFPTKDYPYPVYANGDETYGYAKSFRIDKYAVTISSIGNVGTAYYREPNFTPIIRLKTFIPKGHNLNVKFLYYCLSAMSFVGTNSSLSSMKAADFHKIQIPIPPLPIQTEIVRILDKFVEQQEQLERLIELRKKQYEYYREEMLKPKEGEDTIPLSDIAEIGTGSSNTNEELENGKYPFFVRSQEVRSKDEYEFDEEAVITSGDGVGVGKIFHYVNGKYALHQRAYRIHITDSNYNPKFFFYYMKNTFLDYISRTEVKSSVQSIRRPMLNKYPVPCYSIEKQKEIIDIFDSFESSLASLKSALELSKKRYEYYRDQMMRF